jgi:pyrimidine-nucleoside phosphorylase
MGMGHSEDSADFRDVVAAKRDRHELDEEDLRRFVLGYARGAVPDYLASAFLMAALLSGLSEAETLAMTRAMVDSGRTIALKGIGRPTVDKHSTGGVSDGVTLVLAPLAASLGLGMAKLSGRGLGHTGGTLDKLESIPGLRTDLSPEELERQVETIGCAVAGQSKDLVPADGALYALRDATATIPSIQLIAASVMCKKFAVETDLVLLDVKAGSGAFMKTPESAAELAATCSRLAEAWGRAARIAVTDMGQPLGCSIGNALDVREGVRVLRGEQRGRLRDLTTSFAVEAIRHLRGLGHEEALKEVDLALDGGAAAEAFARMVEAQGGDPEVVEHPDGVLPRAPVQREVLALTGGWLASIETGELGRAAGILGAGRAHKGDPIDPAVGLEFWLTVGQRVEPGQSVARVHARDETSVEPAARRVQEAIVLLEEPVQPPPLVYGWYGQAGSGSRPAPAGTS